ncbi:hypothetical protein MSG28_004513 [Choristoneura fumiferana]|uniref:Uncharacterized protein n=1 Tax=Choristoneura fumiferana TaxID=7141 RepID=A0ACC0K6I4_CHOFU|nr:hypothetical protein MSG28_004513 [Choristoneura fumiferana]
MAQQGSFRSLHLALLSVRWMCFYFIAVIKSMILKLKAEAKTTHTNANGEAHVVLDMPITEEQDIKYDVERSNSESGEIRMKSVFPVDDLKRLQQQDS